MSESLPQQDRTTLFLEICVTSINCQPYQDVWEATCEWKSRNLGVTILSVDVRALATASGQKAEQSIAVSVITVTTDGE